MEILHFRPESVPVFTEKDFDRGRERLKAEFHHRREQAGLGFKGTFNLAQATVHGLCIAPRREKLIQDFPTQILKVRLFSTFFFLQIS